MSLYSKEAAKNIKKFNPQAKIIIMLRSPVELMHSLYWHLHTGGQENALSFEEALVLEKKRKKGKNLPQTKLIIKDLFFYREIVCFYKQIKRYFDLFPKSQIKIIIFEDFKKDTKKVYQQTLKFLGVNSDFEPHFEILNSNKTIRNNPFYSFLTGLAFKLNLRGNKFFLLLYRLFKKIEALMLTEIKRPPMKPETEKRLKKEFLPDVRKLSKLIVRDVTYWCK